MMLCSVKFLPPITMVPPLPFPATVLFPEPDALADVVEPICASGSFPCRVLLR